MNLAFFRVSFQNLWRNLRGVIYCSIGVIMGISMFAFFNALSNGVERLILGKIFNIRFIEVVPRSYDLGFIKTDGILGKKLDDRAVEHLKQVPGIQAVYPKMQINFPFKIWGGRSILGKDAYGDGAGDGIDESLVKEDVAPGYQFGNYLKDRACNETGDCPADMGCANKICRPISCRSHQDCSQKNYCNQESLSCEKPIPVLLSPQLLDLVSSILSASYKLPKLSQALLIGKRGNVKFGVSHFGYRARSGQPLIKQFEIVGFSDKAMYPIGMTMPLPFVKSLNQKYADEKENKIYSSIIVEAKTNKDVAFIREKVKEAGFDLSRKDDLVKGSSIFILIVTLIFYFISIIIVLISALNIMHLFFMMVYERRKEIAIFRSTGATKWDIRKIILSEALIIGLFSSLLGCGLGYLTAQIINFSLKYLQIPFKPDTLFVFTPALLLTSILFGVGFCLLGALLPANKAANMNLSEALSGQ